MKDKPGTTFSVAAAGLLLLGDLGLFFAQTRIAGYAAFLLGCILGIVSIARANELDNDEKFHFLVAILGLLILGIFMFTGVIFIVVILGLMLFAVDFLLALLDLRSIYEEEEIDMYYDEYAQPSVKEPIKEIKSVKLEKPFFKENLFKERPDNEKKFEEFQKRKVYDDLDSIKEQIENIKIIDDGETEDKLLRRQAEQIKKEFKGATFLESERNTSKKNEELRKKKDSENLESIKKQLESVRILEDGRTDDKVLRKAAEQIKKEIRGAIVVEDPKAGRYFYKEDGKTFHVAGCMALKRINKKDKKSSQSRTELLARGYKPCKICSA
jgi:hypothetical protein